MRCANTLTCRRALSEGAIEETIPAEKLEFVFLLVNGSEGTSDGAKTANCSVFTKSDALKGKCYIIREKKREAQCCEK